jgi:membrane protein required for colicin V production
MLTIDYILLAILIVSVVVGVFRGFVKEALSLVTWFVALWAALRFGHLLEPMLASVSSDALKIWSARIIAFILILIAGGLINALVGMLVAKTGLTGTDRILGMVFGAARGVLIVGIVVMMFRMLELDQDEWWSQSAVVPYGEPVAEQLQHYFHKGLEKLDELVEPEAPEGADDAENEAEQLAESG